MNPRAEKIMKPHAPVAGRRAGNARNQKPKGHRADGCFGAERGTENGQMSELQMQPVGGNPEKVPPSKGSPDGNQQEAEEQGFGRRGGRMRNTALHPNDKGQRQRQAFPPLGWSRGGGKGTDY